MSWRKCVVIDFESVIATKEEVALSNIKDAVRRLRENGFRVEITSPRCSEIAGICDVEECLVENGIEFDYVRYGIPPCLCYVANNAVRFTGDVQKLLSQIAEMSE